MTGNVCVCRTCVDPRENGFFAQHGLPPFSAFMVRRSGGFVPRPSPAHDVSTSGLMLMELGKSPIFVLQGHRHCAAIGVLFRSHGKPPEAWTDTERAFQKSHGEALEAVKQLAANLPEEPQLRILEKACALQSVNNFFQFDEVGALQKNTRPILYVYYSQSPLSADDLHTAEDAAKLPLMIFDPAQGVFVQLAAQGNEGLRASDLIDMQRLVPFDRHAFQVSQPVDLRAVIRNELRFAMAGTVPLLEKPDSAKIVAAQS
ncbi:MAG TPA: hypothetical protein VHB73_06355 [Alphaproteobacteria bacterium]|nr:hypothetical protein [Alphaproteobacteria bacterium]